MNLTETELEKRKKINKTILKWTFILLIIISISFLLITSTKTDKESYHYRKGYFDRNGQYHKGGTVKNPISK
jgi:hypothetical protein